MSKAIELRAEMARMGWWTEDRLTKHGWGDKGPGYSIWIRRYSWHGVQTGNSICFHEHTSDLSLAEEAVYIAVNRAKLAWAMFTESVPCQDAKGNVVEDALLTRLCRERLIEQKTKGNP